MYFSRLILLFCLLCALPLAAMAQEAPTATEPNFTAQTLEDRINIIEASPELAEEQKEQARTSLRTAIDRLSEATRQTERRAQYANAVQNAAALRNELSSELEAAQAELAQAQEPMAEMIGQDALFELEQELIAKESDLAEVETRLQALQDTLIALSARQTAAPAELAEARTALSELQTRLNTLGDGELETVSEARRTEARARAWYRRNQIRALEQEISTLPMRQELLSLRQSIADANAQSLRRDVARISSRTGQKRVNEARELRDQLAEQVAGLEGAHPFLSQFAQANLELADQVAAMAAISPEISQATASVRGRVVDVENDLNAATRLVAQGHLDREAGATLRRLGNQLQTPESIRADMRQSQDRLATATRQRIIAQEDLRDLPIGGFDFETALEAARRDVPDLPDLTEGDKAVLNGIFDRRRNLLRQISSLSNTRINTVSELQAEQASLLEKTERLQTLLNENLLWVRSVPAIDLSFPRKVVSGAAELFSPSNMTLAVTELLRMARSYFLVVIGFLLVTFSLYRLRPRVREEVDRRAAMVGRVKQDSAWHTPIVMIAGLFNSLPLPLIFLLIALLYGVSENPDRIISGLANGFAYLSLFTLIFGAWIRWDREGGLFDTHFKLSADIRHTIAVNLRWFVPVMGATSTLLLFANEMAEDNITEGFSVFVFILTALSMIVFAARVLWTKRAETSQKTYDESFTTRFRGPLAIFIIGLPLIALGLATSGYYESAMELLDRLFSTGIIVLLTYVVYGSVRRAIVVAQRQIKYRQALEKREAELKARADKEAAEERGEETPAPPPVDTSAIDVTSITRQTSKLLQTLVFLGCAALLWMVWSSLVPALTIFDGFTVWPVSAGVDAVTGEAITRNITLWDIIQSLVILALTFIAARNLPGFLEIFVLNRMGVDAGTRYAVTTVLGYIIVAAGIIIGFNQLGLQWSQLRWIVTGLSVGIGFGLQKIIANFVSGLIILFERPIRIGDYVTIGDQSGTVSRIKIRATTLRDLDNLEILIPNEALISERVTNWTLSSSVTRLMVPVGIAYGSDTDHARDIMLEAVKSVPKVLTNPPPQVLFMGFGDSSLNFEIRVFLNSFDDRVPMIHTIHTEINKALETAGIPIPFPQRDLNIVSQGVPLEISTKTPVKRKKPTTQKKS